MAIRTEYLTPPQNFRSALFDDNNSYPINEYLTGNKTVIDYSSGDSAAFVYDRSAFSTEPGYLIGLEYWDAANNVVAITSGFSYYIDGVRGAEAALTKLFAQNVEINLTQYDDWYWFDPAGDAIADSQTSTGRTLFIDGGRGEDTFYDHYWGEDNLILGYSNTGNYQMTFVPTGESFELRNFEKIQTTDLGVVTLDEYYQIQNAPSVPAIESAYSAPVPSSSGSKNDPGTTTTSKNDPGTTTTSKNDTSTTTSESKNSSAYNEIVGSKAGEILQGTTGNDLIRAMDGDDTVNVSGGNDLVHGGLGINSLVFSEPSTRVTYSNAYVVEQDWTFTEKVTTSTGSVTFTSIDRLVFNDLSFARDTASNEYGAGMVARLIIAGFGVDQLSEILGTGLTLSDAGQTKSQLIDIIIASNLVEFNGDSSDFGFVTEIFDNLIGGEPNFIQTALYISLVETQGRGAFLELAADHDLTTQILEDQITLLGLPYQESL